jgi:D-glycero-alpha-D-manno-heptose-7-phosphate kinase
MRYISKTPLRVSLFGGGTDYPDYLKEHPGAVLGTTINKFVYIFALPMAGVAEKPIRLTYRLTEEVESPEELKHPVVREVLRELAWTSPINIATMSDLPGGTGLGSSSAFTVGILNLIHRLKGRIMSRYDLAREAIRVEAELLQENVGVQDQIHAAYGGMNLYSLARDDFSITPIMMNQAVLEGINKSMLLVFSGRHRHASEVLEEQVKGIRQKKFSGSLEHLSALAHQASHVLRGRNPDAVLSEIGRMLHEGWLTKRSLSPSISNEAIDEIYRIGMSLGAYGGKLCGAGGGGFLFFLAPPETHSKFIEAFGGNSVFRVEMTDFGSRIHEMV